LGGRDGGKKSGKLLERKGVGGGKGKSGKE